MSDKDIPEDDPMINALDELFSETLVAEPVELEENTEEHTTNINEIPSWIKYSKKLYTYLTKLTGSTSLLITTIVAIVATSLFDVLSSSITGNVFTLSPVVDVLKFVIAPFIMLIVFRNIQNVMSQNNRESEKELEMCRKQLAKNEKCILDNEYENRLEIERMKGKYELQLQQQKGKYDIEIAQLNGGLKVKDYEIEKLRNEILILKGGQDLNT